MYTYIYCSTIYNSKYMESIQMSINERLNKENVAHIHRRIICSHKNGWVHALCRDMDEAGNHDSQQTDTRTENQTLHVLTHRRVMKMRTHGYREGSTKHWGLLGGKGEGQWEGELGRDRLGRNAKCGWRGERKQNTLPRVYLCNCLACSAHVLQT